MSAKRPGFTVGVVVGVGELEGVGLLVGDELGVGEAVGLLVAVGVLVGVAVAVGVVEGVGLLLGVLETVGEGVGVAGGVILEVPVNAPATVDKRGLLRASVVTVLASLPVGVVLFGTSLQPKEGIANEGTVKTLLSVAKL